MELTGRVQYVNGQRGDGQKGRRVRKEGESKRKESQKGRRIRGVKFRFLAPALAGLQFLHPATAQPRSQALLPVKIASNRGVSHIYSI